MTHLIPVYCCTPAGVCRVRVSPLLMARGWQLMARLDPAPTFTAQLQCALLGYLPGWPGLEITT